jgi:multicomponent Na+:H+ antiporter subunit G
MQIIGLIAFWIGLFFCIVGVVGLLRFPDVYSRLHASGKVGTMGLVGLLISAAVLLPETGLRALALAIFVIITFPAATHAIASAAYRIGVPVVGSGRDDFGREPVQLEGRDQGNK